MPHTKAKQQAEPIVHALELGEALCSDVKGDPRTWPDGHLWVAWIESEHVTCEGCRFALFERGRSDAGRDESFLIVQRTHYSHKFHIVQGRSIDVGRIDTLCRTAVDSNWTKVALATPQRVHDYRPDFCLDCAIGFYERRLHVALRR